MSYTRASETTRRSRRGYVRATLVAVVVTLSLALPSIPHAEASTSSQLSGCNYATARVLGWVWADGHYNEERDYFFVRTSNRALSNHMRSLMDDLDIEYKTGVSRSGRHYNNRVFLPGYDERLMTRNPMNNSAISCRPRAFLASVIEGEGSTSGKIMDDPKASRRNGAVAVLNAMNMDSYISGQGVFIESYDRFRLRVVPFMVCDRVPGGDRNCTLGLTPA